MTLALEPEALLALLEDSSANESSCVHSRVIPQSTGITSSWPEWVSPSLVSTLSAAGITKPWRHQVEFAQSAHHGNHSILATGTATGKTIAFSAPALTSVINGGTVLYVAPTKALAADQLATISGWGLDGVRSATLDGDSSREERQWIRSHANYILTNPDMLHYSILPMHRRWAHFLRHLEFIIIDEAHAYKGVFGAHVAMILRRTLRLAQKYGASPTVLAASATTGNPDKTLEQLIGRAGIAFTDNYAATPERTFLFWQPPLLADGQTRRGVLDESARLLAATVPTGHQSVAFLRSRRGVEYVSQTTKDLLASTNDPKHQGGIDHMVRAYRGGYLAHERRELERDLRSGEIRAMAATNALELGIDITGLDMVITAGWPGTKASLLQQVGRAGRAGEPAAAIFIAREDPLDTFVINNPDVVFDSTIEVSLPNANNEHVMAPHLCAAAQELALTREDIESWFPPNAPDVISELVTAGMLRERPTGWYWTKSENATDLADIRGTGGAVVRVVEMDTGRLCGYVDHGASHRSVHEGAVYVHQGETFLVRELDLNESVALVVASDLDYTTFARDVSDIRITGESAQRQVAADIDIHFGDVEVSSQTVAYTRRHISGENLGTIPLDLPVRTLRTKAVWWTFPSHLVNATADVLAGAIHGAEHASIGILPLFASCDRWDIGGVSTILHPDTETTTIFIYDGLDGGAGIAEFGFEHATQWMKATLAAVESCSCDIGCPACIQSPKCGNGNDPLDKAGAIQILTRLSGLPAQ